MPQKRIHCYAASFGNDMAKELVRRYCPKGGTVVDPFSGSGTTLIEALTAGNHAIGIDVDPIAILIATIETRKYRREWLERFLKDTLEKLAMLERELGTSIPASRQIKPGISFGVNGYTAQIPSHPGVEYWFSPSQMAVLAALTAFSAQLKSARGRQIFRLAISSAIVRKWPNTLSRAMDIDHSRPHLSHPVHKTTKQQFTLFRRIFTEAIKSLQRSVDITEGWKSEADVMEGNCAESLYALTGGTVDLVLSSPPYVNAIDYPRAHKFSEWWLNGEIQRCRVENYIGLRSARKDVNLIETAAKLAPISLQTLTWLKRKSNRKYRLLCTYVIDMAKVIGGCRHVLRTNGKLVFVLADNKIGERTIPVVNIIKELLRANGFKRVTSTRRRLKNHRRRYPFGFDGVMKSEAIITALKTKR